MKLVPENSSTFKIHFFRCRLHIFLECLYKRRIFPLKQITGFYHILPILLFRTIIPTGRATQIHVVLKARATDFHAPAGSDRIQSADKAQCFPQAPHIGKRPKIFSAVISSDISCHKNTRPFFINRNFHIGIRFIITERNIVLRMQFFNQIAFQNKSFHLCCRHGDIQIRCMTDHGCHFGRAFLVFPHIGTNSVF